MRKANARYAEQQKKQAKKNDARTFIYCAQPACGNLSWAWNPFARAVVCRAAEVAAYGLGLVHRHMRSWSKTIYKRK